MPSMRAVLEERQKVAAVRVQEFEAELEQVRAALAAAEEVHRHR
ncbi:MarR family transcriptional regulator OS=Streptomyces griseomycini OX=66895 GN=FHS37_007771 PE=4 SV=1 [Streptomyces griseomycini]